MDQAIEKSLRGYEIKSTAAFLSAMLFLALGLFGVIRGGLAFIAFLAASAVLLTLCWFVSPAYQYKSIPAHNVDPIPDFPEPKSIYHYWRKYRTFDHELGLPKKKIVTLLPILITAVVTAAVFVAVFVFGNMLFPPQADMMNMGGDPGMSMGGNSYGGGGYYVGGGMTVAVG